MRSMLNLSGLLHRNRAVIATIVVWTLIAGCYEASVEPKNPPRSGHVGMNHSENLNAIMPGLCKLRSLVRLDEPQAYETYSSEIMDPLHSFLNELLDVDSRGARPLLRSENLLEISLLSDDATGQTLRTLTRVIRLLRPRLRESGYDFTCN